MNIIVGSHVWVEDPELAWIDGEVTDIKGNNTTIVTTNGKTVSVCKIFIGFCILYSNSCYNMIKVTKTKLCNLMYSFLIKIIHIRGAKFDPCTYERVKYIKRLRWVKVSNPLSPDSSCHFLYK